MNRPSTTAPVFPALSPSSADQSPSKRAFATYLGDWAMWLLFAFLTISTFDGAIRYYLASAGLAWAVYIKDVLVVAVLVLGFGSMALTSLRNLAFVTVLSFLIVGTAIGAALLPDVRQPLFAAKTWLPLLCGTAVGPVVMERMRAFSRGCRILWAVTVGGVILTYLWSAPWVGFVYDVGGITVEGSREWTIGDAQRVPGFSRASFDAAIQCIFFGAIAISALRFYVVSFVFWLLSGVAVYLTLSRSAVVALAAAFVVHALVVSLKSGQRLAKVAVVALAVVVVALPFAARKYYQNKAGRADSSTVASTSSFEERAVQTWPDGLKLVSDRGNWITGRGLGGIGVAQQLYENDRFNPGDNFFIYLWGALGALGMVFLAFIPWQAWRAAVPLNRTRQAAVVIVASFLTVGFTLNAIEAPVASLFLGMALVWLTDRSQDDEAYA